MIPNAPHDASTSKKRLFRKLVVLCSAYKGGYVPSQYIPRERNPLVGLGGRAAADSAFYSSQKQRATYCLVEAASTAS